MPLDASARICSGGWCRSSWWERTGGGPASAGIARLQTDPAWKDNLLFHEYFHGDDGAGLGASHQTGWTGIVADVIRRRHGSVASVGDVLRSADPP